jgi:hypothetical protein
LIRSPLSADETQMVLPNADHPEYCEWKLASERRGVLPYAPFLLETGRRGNVFIRDMHDGNDRLLRRFPDRPVYRVLPGVTAEGAVRVDIAPLSLDSARLEWRVFAQERARALR